MSETPQLLDQTRDERLRDNEIHFIHIRDGQAKGRLLKYAWAWASNRPKVEQPDIGSRLRLYFEFVAY